jgi:hypothetical protein
MDCVLKHSASVDRRDLCLPSQSSLDGRPGADPLHVTRDRWLAAGSVDLGVVLNPPAARNAVPLGRDAWVPILPATHPLSRRTSLSFVELAAAPFVLATGGCHVNARSLAEAAGWTLHSVQIEVRDWSSAIALVREGVGSVSCRNPPCRRSDAACGFRSSLHRCIASSGSSLRRSARCRGLETCLSRSLAARPRRTIDLERTLTRGFPCVVTKQAFMKTGELAKRSGLSANPLTHPS